MIPIFGYGDDVSSSSAIESSFRKLKTVTFKHISLPTDIEQYLETHILSLKEATLIRSARNMNDLSTLSVVSDRVGAEYDNDVKLPPLDH